MQLTLPQAMDMAMTHLKNGRSAAGISMLRQIVAIQPDHPVALGTLGIALFNAQQVDESLKTFEQVTRLHPTWPDGWTNFAVILHRVGRLEDAAAALRKAMEHGGESPVVLNNLGGVLQDLGRYDEAIDLHRRSITLKPDSASAYSNLGNALKFSGQLDEAISAFRRAIELSPEDPTLHHFLGLTLLLKGDYESGLAEHEWRSRIKGPQQYCADFPQPRWNGEALNDRKLLIHAEQGFGDTIQFARYLPLVRERGGSIILRCQPELVRLMAGNSPAEQIVSETAPLPPFDLHCPLMSLPFVFRTTLDSIPATAKYISADSALVDSWRERLAPLDGKKIGIAWAGKKTYSDDRNRSMPLSTLSMLAGIDGVSWISLQKNPMGPATASETGLKITDFAAGLTDFAETAALIEHLDLVISVDTAVAHLAAAMGKPVHLLLPFVPDWRWLMNRPDSPWYPTIKLFRQPTAGDWQAPVREIVRLLAAKG